MFGRGPHRELVHVRLAERDEACLAQSGDGSRIVGRHPTLKDFGARGGGHVRGAEHVLDGDGNSGERVNVDARTTSRVHFFGDGQRRVGNVKEGAEVSIDLGDAVEVRAGELDAGNLSRLEQCRLLGSRETNKLGHSSSPKIAVTRNREPS